MTVDLLQVLPDFDTKPYSHILPSLDKALITTNDLVTLDAADLAKRAQVPLGDLKKLTEAILLALHRQLGFGDEEAHSNGTLSSTVAGKNTASEWNAISTLDDGLDATLGGGIPTGYLIEVTGERYERNPQSPGSQIAPHIRLQRLSFNFTDHLYPVAPAKPNSCSPYCSLPSSRLHTDCPNQLSIFQPRLLSQLHV
jgi:hypothetical protein